MDFVRDLVSEAKKALDEWQIDYSDSKDDFKIVEKFVEICLKRIPVGPRRVVKSTEIATAALEPETHRALAEIEAEFRDGRDVNPRLNIPQWSQPDYLFFDLDIRHLHLGCGPHKRIKGFRERTRNILFVTISQDSAYLIDVRPHGRGGEPHVFGRKEFIDIIAREWPHLIERQKMEGVVGLEYTTDDAKEIDRLRKADVNIAYEASGSFYGGIGGQAISGAPFAVVMGTRRLYDIAERAMLLVRDDRSKFDSILSVVPGYNPNKAAFSLRLGEEGPLIYEETTKRGFRLYPFDQAAR